MLLDITHNTTYRYSRPVFLKRQILRLIPRTDQVQQVVEQEIEILPEPAGRSTITGVENNLQHHFWYTETVDTLEIRSRCRVRTRTVNPFDFLPDGQLRLPFDVPPISQDVRKYLERQDEPPEDPVRIWSNRLRDEVDGDAIDFLVHMNATMADRYEITFREKGFPWAPAQTLAADRAACRDVAALYIDACRCQGLPARFTSGYTRHRDPDGMFHLHAWPEVYLPGGGWKGFDPTMGIAVADAHVAICSAAEPRHAAPLSGQFLGTDIESTLETSLDISVEEERP